MEITAQGLAKPVPKIDLLVFDLDGTLIDSCEDLVQSVNAARGCMGLPTLPPDTVASYVGRGVVTLMRRALGPDYGEDDVNRAVEFFLDYYREHMLDHTVAYPGVAEALDQMRGRSMAVLTNKPVRFSQAILDGLGLAPYFVRVYGGNSFEQKKPDPVGLFTLMGETGASPTATMIVGDSDTDVLTGKNAGAWTCGVTYGLAPETLHDPAPDFLLGNLRELPALLDRSSEN